ncbi:hypothetical protein K0M31_009749 [Melipona bicolor]|uniref:Uncharacterized protein n=1 Tax=Melipona bicolor TaxID=60889 RepID=A0AA40FML2_9HYME|nr:hypothetical protein K0M31_009749 [Melipona bicolor]
MRLGKEEQNKERRKTEETFGDRGRNRGVEILSTTFQNGRSPSPEEGAKVRVCGTRTEVMGVGKRRTARNMTKPWLPQVSSYKSFLIAVDIKMHEKLVQWKHFGQLEPIS